MYRREGVRVRICLDCGEAGLWPQPKGSRAVRCGPCKAAYDRFRGGHYRAVERMLPPPMRPCELCGARADLTYDHVVPISRGGRSVMSNLRVLCRRCNSRKGNR